MCEERKANKINKLNLLLHLFCVCHKYVVFKIKSERHGYQFLMCQIYR